MSTLHGKQKRTIRDRLVYLYRDKKDHIPLIAEDIGLSVSNLSDDITICCHRICTEAERQGKFTELIERVLEEYPDTELQTLFTVLTQKLEPPEGIPALTTETLTHQEELKTQEPSLPAKPPQPTASSGGEVSKLQFVARPSAGNGLTTLSSASHERTETPNSQPAPTGQIQNPGDISKNGCLDRTIAFWPKLGTLTTLLLSLFLIILTILYWNNHTNIFLLTIIMVATIVMLLLWAYNVFLAKEQREQPRRHLLTGLISWHNIIVLVVVVISIPFNAVSAIEIGKPIPQPTPTPINDNGIGIDGITIDGFTYKIGITDGSHGLTPFSVDERQTDALTKIFDENKAARRNDNYFTTIVVATLSESLSDPGQSRGVGTEQLQGTYLAQKRYNEGAAIKMQILVANIGTKTISNQTADKVSSRIVRYARSKDATGRDHFIGVQGFPFSRAAEAGLPLLTANHIPVISSAASSDQFSKTSYFHRVIVATGDQNPYLVKFIKQFLFPRKIVIAGDLDDTYSRDFAKSIESELRKENYTLIRQDYGENLESLQKLSSVIKVENPDLLVFTGFPKELSKLKDICRSNGFEAPPTLGGGALYELSGYTDNNYSDVFFISTSFPDGLTKAEQDFQDYYKATFDPGGTHPGRYGWSKSNSGYVGI